MSNPGAVLVDGYNVLHAIARFAPRGGPLEPAREAFEAWLAGAARRHGSPDTVLVWDGRRGSRAPRSPTPLIILYTDKGRTADERILALCRGRYASRAAATWVVSSDRGVQTPARQLGFTTLGAMTFYRRWSVRAGASGSPASAAAADATRVDKPRRPTRSEVDELLEEFLNEGDEE